MNQRQRINRHSRTQSELVALGKMALLATFLGGAQFSASGAEEGADVSVWDSALAPTAETVPIGGEGEVNGEFIVDTVTLSDGVVVQVGIRARDALAGPILPRDGSTYFAEPGELEPGLATWNIDFHIDTGTSFLADQTGATTPISIHEFAAVALTDLDPGVAVNIAGFSVNEALNDQLGVGSHAVLFQNSHNIGADGQNPNGPGIFDFKIEVLGENGSVASASCRVIVGSGDIDGDGVREDLDACPASNTEPNLFIDGCFTGVPNRWLSEDCTLSDRITTLQENSTNKGQFVSSLTRFLISLQREGSISRSEFRSILHCATTLP